MEYYQIKMLFKQNLNDEQKQKIRDNFQGNIFCLNETIKNGAKFWISDIEKTKEKYKGLYSKIIELDT